MANECANNAYHKVADESKASATNDFSGKPAGDKTDDQYNKKTLI